jgi:hypothetical protein
MANWIVPSLLLILVGAFCFFTLSPIRRKSLIKSLTMWIFNVALVALATIVVIAGLTILGLHKPVVLFSGMFGAVGGFVLYIVIRSLRRGVVSVNARNSISVYERSMKPFGFWFYILLFTIIGFAFMGYAIYLAIHPESIRQ